MSINVWTERALCTTHAIIYTLDATTYPLTKPAVTTFPRNAAGISYGSNSWMGPDGTGLAATILNSLCIIKAGDSDFEGKILLYRYLPTLGRHLGWSRANWTLNAFARSRVTNVPLA
jgi:hypothetical protein